MQFGTQLRRIRQTRKQTLAEVGAATDLSVSYLSKLERSLTEPTLGTLTKLSQHFDVSVATILAEPDSVSWTKTVHRPSFREFIERMNGQVDKAMQDLLLHVDTQAVKPAKSVDEWLQYYYVLSAITTRS